MGRAQLDGVRASDPVGKDRRVGGGHGLDAKEGWYLQGGQYENSEQKRSQLL